MRSGLRVFPRYVLLLLACVTLCTGLLQPVHPALAATGANWTGTYFNNRDLNGAPVFTRIDQAVVFNWGPNSPGPGLGSQNWSARWVTIQYLTAGTYRFTVTADDGVRVYINGQQILNQWREQAPTTFTVDVQVSTGNQAIQVDYFQGIGDARVTVSWDPIYSQSNVWTAQYFNNSQLQGAPAVTRYESTIDYFWGNGAPVAGIAADNWSARWTITQPFAAGTYRFTLGGDDGVRLFIDDAPVVDRWAFQGFVAYSIDVNLNAGLHTLRVEYNDLVGFAAVRFRYDPAIGPPPYPGLQTGSWFGEYYTNTSLAGIPFLTRNEGNSGINFDLSRGLPSANFPRENFSIRWTRRVCVSGRPYVFYLTTDDGARFYIDTTLVIDAWRVQDRTTYRQPVDLTAGCHDFRVEYFQATGNAVAQLTWDPPEQQNPPQPVGGQQAPPPGGGSIVGTVAGASVLNVRTGPTTNSPRIETIPRGTQVSIVGRNSDSSWLYVNYITTNARAGWVSRAYISFNGNLATVPVLNAPPPSTSPGAGTATGVRLRILSTLRLRTGPGTSFAQLGTLGWGLVVDVTGRNAANTWLQVRFGDITGWVYVPYVQVVSGNLGNVPIVQ